MKPHRIYLIAILLLAFCVGANGQEPPKAVLVDEFGKITCEDLLARNDHFLTQLSNNPQDIGYAVIDAHSGFARGLVRYLEASLFIRKFDRSRIEIVMASNLDTSDMLGAFWRVLPGATPPVLDRVEMSAPDLTKPFVVGDRTAEDVCPSFSPVAYAKLVIDNPGSRARLVISGPTRKLRRTAANEELEIFRQWTKLPQNRIQLFFVHRPRDTYTTTEYWFIPGKTR